MYYNANGELDATPAIEYELDFKTLKQVFGKIPDLPQGRNLQYSLSSMLLGALLAL
ncbi:MAG: hypothetical protein HXX08_21265 [Chloroflexi bacterium]|uniref:Transposase family protein n=1 Tax=Candidatus Chlorohelix allophototropha TaxID=3003348 RepID=A0A8T7M8L4_9CHLR|nr:hypothetical protein [Chloroflexota bacterium]WJW68328.1 transposase family protein [Chloroflexota bacterium L227-S17]